ncbi:hypothetical protein C8F04DRAFT_1340921 [Mycena alexandri]|uniref:Uncharacterized protein n=1 Tax=Mycena alexandri TaxID=1745969 RepID=A0AAD6SYA4_9AGAR|nr:hypothetical protein C8F04DRAFT_1340921 [Mycena alexandri]
MKVEAIRKPGTFVVTRTELRPLGRFKWKYSPGEIKVYQRWMDVHGSSRIVCLRIWGFATGSCEGKRVYRQQLHQLRRILNVDDSREVSVAESWFDMGSYCQSGKNEMTAFMAIKPGDGIAFCCTMTRIDRTVARSKIANPGIWRRPDSILNAITQTRDPVILVIPRLCATSVVLRNTSNYLTELLKSRYANTSPGDLGDPPPLRNFSHVAQHF